MKKFIIEPEYSGFTVGDYLKQVKGYSSRGLKNADIYLNGKKVRLDKKIKKLNRLVVAEAEKGTNIAPIPMDLKIVYEDKNLLIINKDADVVVHPTQKKVDKTLANGIVDYLKTTGKIQVPRFYNRLDMNTSGLIVVAKNGFAQAYLQEKAETRKFYMAVCEGIIEKDEFFIERPIGRVGDEIKEESFLLKREGRLPKQR